MAPEIVFKELEGLAPSQAVLDPMSGSGTVLRAASELGHRAIGFDLDPLAVLMARVWTTSLSSTALQRDACRLIETAKALKDDHLPWIDECGETKEYVGFWFCRKQVKALRRLSSVLAGRSGVLADAMRIALSRIIITKERGASVARDTSHSRPHRVFFENDYDVYRGFLQSATRLASRLMPEKLLSTVDVSTGDARLLRSLRPNSIDVVITSPPYLNAIDYLRGHRLALVWLGYTLREIRMLRSRTIGAECGTSTSEHDDKLLANAGHLEKLPTRELGMVRHYAQDVRAFLRELKRVVKKDGRVVLVVGNSCLKGISVSNADINVAAAESIGLKSTGRSERTLPVAHRYLPLPAVGASGSLAGRMRTETLLSFSAS